MYTLVPPPPPLYSFLKKFALIGQAVSEIFGYHGSTHVYCPMEGAGQTPGSNFFSESYIFSPFPARFFLPMSNTFTHSNAWVTHVDLAIK